MERALDEGVVEFAEEHNLISQHQFEFRKAGTLDGGPAH